MFEFQLSSEYDLLGFLLNSSLSSSSAAISYQSFKERLIQQVPRPALLYSVDSIFFRTLSRNWGCKSTTSFSHHQIFSQLFLELFHFALRISANGTAKLVQLFSLSNIPEKISCILSKLTDLQLNNLFGRPAAGPFKPRFTPFCSASPALFFTSDVIFFRRSSLFCVLSSFFSAIPCRLVL